MKICQQIWDYLQWKPPLYVNIWMSAVCITTFHNSLGCTDWGTCFAFKCLKDPWQDEIISRRRTSWSTQHEEKRSQVSHSHRSLQGGPLFRWVEYLCPHKKYLAKGQTILQRAVQWWLLSTTTRKMKDSSQLQKTKSLWMLGLVSTKMATFRSGQEGKCIFPQLVTTFYCFLSSGGKGAVSPPKL